MNKSGQRFVRQGRTPILVLLTLLLLVFAAGSYSGAQARRPFRTSVATLRTVWHSAGGPAWRITPSPSGSGPATFLKSIACASRKNCVAVGSSGNAQEASGHTFIEVWNGVEWRVMASPNVGVPNNQLLSVSCSFVGHCIAVGFAGSAEGSRTLAEIETGTSWHIMSSGNEAAPVNELLGVTCHSSSDCVAVGYSGSQKGAGGNLVARTLVESWNGVASRIESSPDAPNAPISELTAVSCLSLQSCMAVGFYAGELDSGSGTFAEHWNGDKWTAQPGPNRTGFPNNKLVSVFCTASEGCIASGYSFNSSNTHTVALIAVWNGVHWIGEAPANRQQGLNLLYGSSCTSAQNCVFVGLSGDASGTNTRTLVESLIDGIWTIVPSANAPTPLNSLFSVSCPSARYCISVGISGGPGYASFRPLIERDP